MSVTKLDEPELGRLEKRLSQVVHRNTVNMGTLRAQVRAVLPLVDNYDTEALKSIAEEVKPAVDQAAKFIIEKKTGLPLKGAQIVAFGNHSTGQHESLEAVPEAKVQVKGSPTGNEGVQTGNEAEFEVVQSQESLMAGMELLRRINNSYDDWSPRQGRALRSATLVLLAAYLDSFLHDLIKVYYDFFPDKLDDSDSKFSLKELIDIGSVEEARQLVITREIDKVLRRSFLKQCSYFKDTLNVSFDIGNEDFTLVNEAVQRRHLAVHNDLRVSSQYINAVGPKIADKYSAKIGDRLEIDGEYLTDCIDAVSYFSFVVSLNCAQTWSAGSLNEWTSNQFTNYQFRILEIERYSLCARISKLAKKFIGNNDSKLKIGAINYCTSISLGNLGVDKKAVLSTHDWSASSLKYKIAYHIHTDDIDFFYDNIENCIAINEVHVSDLRNWPLFRVVKDIDPVRFNDMVSMLDAKYENTNSEHVHLENEVKLDDQSIDKPSEKNIDDSAMDL